MYLGRAPSHSDEVWRFLNIQKTKVVLSRDITWLNQLYRSWKFTNNGKMPPQKGKHQFKTNNTYLFYDDKDSDNEDNDSSEDDMDGGIGIMGEM
jgi:hypothetical protein